MRKLILAAVLALAGSAYADTPTFTPTYTATPTFTPSNTPSPTDVGSQTATPTWTNSPVQSPTSTATPTFSISPTSTFTPTVTLTFTATQVPVRPCDRCARVRFKPLDMRASDSVSILATTPVANGAYLSRDRNIATWIMEVPTPGAEPQVRFRWTVPQDYQASAQPLSYGAAAVYEPMHVWLLGTSSDVGTDVTLALNVYRMRRPGILSNYTGIQTMLGVTTNVQTQLSSYSLSQTTFTAKRFRLVNPTAITQVAKGDELEFQIIKAAGVGDLKLYTVEIEYDRNANLTP